jgi:hypothetical protein
MVDLASVSSASLQLLTCAQAGVGRNVLEAVVLKGNSQVERSRTVGWDKGLAIRKR